MDPQVRAQGFAAGPGDTPGGESGRRMSRRHSPFRTPRAWANPLPPRAPTLRRASRSETLMTAACSWAMKLTAHKTESVCRRYNIVSEADLAEGVERLAKSRPSATSAVRSGGTAEPADRGRRLKSLSCNVPGAGLEPARAFAQRILRADPAPLASDVGGVQEALEARKPQPDLAAGDHD